MALGRAILVHQVAENRRNVIFEDQIFLIHALEQAAAQAVHGLALLVHHVVVFEQMFARFEMLAFHRLLRRLDAAADELRLDRDAFFHAQPLEQFRDPLLGEDAHQVIFKREVEARGAGIALAAGASAKLVVDAARLVAFGAQNVQAADGGNFVVLFVGLLLVAAEDLGPLVGRHGVFIAVVIEDRSRAVFLRTFDLALSHAQLLRDSLLHQSPAWP